MNSICRYSCLRPILLGLVGLTALLAGCTVGEPGGASPDAAIAELDPTGNWSVMYSFSNGCGQMMTTSTSTFTITLAADGYAVTAPGATTTGTLLCTAVDCKLSGIFMWSAGGAQYQQNANLALDAHGKISGNGTEFIITPAGACSLTFTAGGTKT
ncbi:MAG TPA: hypothetical protein VGD37_12545 [Kofleriaceae bacterium]